MGPEDLSRVRYGEFHTLTTIAMDGLITLLLIAALMSTIITATTLSSLTSLFTPISQRTVVTGLLRLLLRRQNRLPQYTNLPSHLPVLPPPPLLLGKMGMSKLPCTTTHPSEKAKPVLGKVLVKEATVAALVVAVM